MEILEIKKLKNCIDLDEVHSIFFDNLISKDFVFALGKNAVLNYYDFLKPFFKIEYNNKYYIKGVVGTNTVSIYIRKNENIAEILNEFSYLINSSTNI